MEKKCIHRFELTIQKLKFEFSRPYNVNQLDINDNTRNIIDCFQKVKTSSIHNI